jgi:3-oxoacyl-[acyl-carrier protein] reductase
MNRGNDVGKLEGKVAFVCGGSQGIGEQIALLFGREGASVAVLASSDLAKAETVAKRIRGAGGQASAHVADVRDAAEVARVAFSRQRPPQIRPRTSMTKSWTSM